MAIDIAQQQHLSGYQRNIVSGWVVILGSDSALLALNWRYIFLCNKSDMF